MSLSHFIRQRRKEQGISQTQLAQYAEVSLNLVHRIENGDCNLQLKPLNKILNVFGYEVGAVPQDRHKAYSEDLL